MMTRPIRVLVCVVLALGLSGADSRAAAETLTVTISSGDWEWGVQEREEGDRIVAPEFGTLQVPGKPALPSKVFYIAVPPDAEVSSVTFEAQLGLLDGKYRIKPGGMMVPARDITQEEYEAARLTYQQNYDAVYSKDDPYPVQSAVHLGRAGFRKYKLVKVRYSPWQYLPKSKRMLYTPELRVHVEYERLGVLDEHVKLHDRVWEDRARGIIVNYDEAQQWYPPVPAPAGLGDYKYIIMCNEVCRDYVETLADWKRSQGMRVYVFTKQWLEENTEYPGEDLERQIRYFLRDHYLDWGAEYFLIVGDHNTIPFRTCDPEGDGSLICATDMYYAELSELDYNGWDDDNDGRFAEYDDDNVDWLLELHVGRLSTNEAGAVGNYGQKVKDYEMDTGSWKRRALFPASIYEFANEDGSGNRRCDSADATEQMIADWTWSGWSVFTMYEQGGIDPSYHPSTYALSQDMLKLVWDDGQYAIVNASGHGNSFGVYRMVWFFDDGDGVPEFHGGVDPEYDGLPFLTRTDLGDLNNDHPSIVFLGGCSCGKYDEFDSLAKQLTYRGGIVTIGASEGVDHVIGWANPYDGGLQTLEYLFNMYLVVYGQRVGVAYTSARYDYATTVGIADSHHQQLLLSMNYFGDPALIRQGTTAFPNLDYYKPASWDYVVVPRGTGDATSTWCPVSATLPGNAASTYLNFGIQNNGSVTAYEVLNHLLIDNAFVKWAKWGWIGSGASTTYPNIGPITVKGGRHTLKVFYDPHDECTETNESDNEWERQYVWTPYQLWNGASVWRSAPPERGTGTYDNCDGFSAGLGMGEYWCAVGIIPHDENDDYDVRLYTDYSGSTNGFDTYHCWSVEAGDQTDFVLVNRRSTGSYGPYYAGVIRWLGGDDGFRIHQSNSHFALSTMFFNGPFTLGGDAVVDMHEVHLTPGTWTVTLDVTGGSADLGVSLYSAAATYVTKANHMTGAVALSNNGADATFTIDVTTDGWYGLAVWKRTSADDGLQNTYRLLVIIDTDGDGLSDTWEQDIVDDDPGDEIESIEDVKPDGDYDEDGLTEQQEYELHTDPTNPDCDNDGLTDGEEVNRYATDPLKPDDITDIYWEQATTSVVITFASELGVEYTLQRADADAYADGLAWTTLPGDVLTGGAPQDVFVDDLTANPQTHAFRFYRIRRTDLSNLSRQTAGVFDLPIDAAATSLYFVSTPLIPDPDHNSVAEVFGEGAARQIVRTNVTLSDLDETTGAISRMRNATGTYSVLVGSAFVIEPGVGYELYPGLGFQTQFTLRLTGYVPEDSLTLPLTKENNQAVRWFGYNLPRTIKLSELGLVEAVTPLWSPTNKVRLLPPGSAGWHTYTYDGAVWSPSDPDLLPGMGIVFIRAGFNNTTDQLVLSKWYLHPPNDW